MEEALFPLADIARELDHFVMLVNPARPMICHRKAEMSLARFRELGFDRAAALWLTRGSYGPGLKATSLAQVAREIDGGWALDPPSRGNADVWRRLLLSDMPILVEAPADSAWITTAIRGLAAPHLVHNTSPDLSRECIELCTRRLECGDDRLLFMFGLHRQDVTIAGRGPTFEMALEALSQVPSRWLTAKEIRSLRAGGFRLLPRGAPGTQDAFLAELEVEAARGR
jgi:hypothetical protein